MYEFKKDIVEEPKTENKFKQAALEAITAKRVESIYNFSDKFSAYKGRIIPNDSYYKECHERLIDFYDEMIGIGFTEKEVTDHIIRNYLTEIVEKDV